MNNRRHDVAGNLIFEDSRFAEGYDRVQVGFKYLVPVGIAGGHHVARYAVASVSRVAENCNLGPSYKLQIMARPA